MKTVPPEFLQSRLVDSELAFVRDNLTAFLETVKKENNGNYPNTKTMLIDYVATLAKKSKKWKGIDQDALSTRYSGVYHMYDMIRKKIKEGVDEKKVVPKATPSKANAKHASAKEAKAED